MNSFFLSPAEAVIIITSLLTKGDFETLSGYYDLSGSEVKRSELVSGDFFIRNTPPEVGHPGGFWKYKHPFAPGFKYTGHHSTDREGVYIVEVGITIDQGKGVPVQRGFSSFYMVKSEKGWQVLPDEVVEK